MKKDGRRKEKNERKLSLKNSKFTFWTKRHCPSNKPKSFSVFELSLYSPPTDIRNKKRMEKRKEKKRDFFFVLVLLVIDIRREGKKERE